MRPRSKGCSLPGVGRSSTRWGAPWRRRRRSTRTSPTNAVRRRIPRVRTRSAETNRSVSLPDTPHRSGSDSRPGEVPPTPWRLGNRYSSGKLPSPVSAAEPDPEGTTLSIAGPERTVLRALQAAGPMAIEEEALPGLTGLPPDQIRGALQRLRSKRLAAVEELHRSEPSLTPRGRAALTDRLPERRLLDLLRTAGPAGLPITDLPAAGSSGRAIWRAPLRFGSRTPPSPGRRSCPRRQSSKRSNGANRSSMPERSVSWSGGVLSRPSGSP